MTTWIFPRSVVLAVKDGDTVVCALDRGFDDKSRRTLRLRRCRRAGAYSAMRVAATYW